MKLSQDVQPFLFLIFFPAVAVAAAPLLLLRDWRCRRSPSGNHRSRDSFSSDLNYSLSADIAPIFVRLKSPCVWCSTDTQRTSSKHT